MMKIGVLRFLDVILIIESKIHLSFDSDRQLT
jgi:hypothetical protein